LVNDLEAVAIRKEPGIRLLKQRLLDLGAVAALMTGTGAAVFGLWGDMQDARAAARQLQADGFWGQAVEILDRRPEAQQH
jgi:4-diphosphocytidyl-2-C-methyl-D-erythritol kinase